MESSGDKEVSKEVEEGAGAIFCSGTSHMASSQNRVLANVGTEPVPQH